MHNSHDQILTSYNAVMRGYLNYYSFVHNYSDLVTMIYYALYGSCAKLLAAKFSLRSIGGVRAKFGKQLSSKRFSLYKPKYAATHKFNLTSVNPNIRLLFATISTATLENLACSVCGSTYRVEMHHIRKLADIKKSKKFVDRLIISRRRKQIPLCRVCRMKHHHPSNSK